MTVVSTYTVDFVILIPNSRVSQVRLRLGPTLYDPTTLFAGSPPGAGPRTLGRRPPLAGIIRPFGPGATASIQTIPVNLPASQQGVGASAILPSKPWIARGAISPDCRLGTLAPIARSPAPGRQLAFENRPPVGGKNYRAWSRENPSVRETCLLRALRAVAAARPPIFPIARSGFHCCDPSCMSRTGSYKLSRRCESSF